MGYHGRTMPVTLKAKTNIQNVDRFLAGLVREYGPKGLQPVRNSIRKAIKPLEAEIKARTPVRTGRLQASVGLSVGSGARNRPVAYGGVGWRFKKGGPILPQALGVEFGGDAGTLSGGGRYRFGQSGKRILRTLFTRNEQRMFDDFKREIRPELDKAYKRLAAKSGLKTT